MRAAAVAIAAALVAACPAAVGAALLAELGERRVAPGSTFELSVAAGEPGASVYVERSPLGATLEPDGPGRWTLRWEVPASVAARTVIRLGAVDRSDRARRESVELALVRDDGPGPAGRATGGASRNALEGVPEAVPETAPETAPEMAPAEARPAPAPAGRNAPGGDAGPDLPEIPPRALVAGERWRLTLPVTGGTPEAPAPASLELRGAPAGLVASPAGEGWYTLSWRPPPSATGTRTVELVAVDRSDPSLRTRRRLVLEVRPGAPRAAPELVELPAAMREGPRLASLPHHVVNPGQDVSFRVGTLGGARARVDVDRLPRGARFDANADGSRTFYWPTSDRDHGEHRFRFTATDPTDPSLRDSADVLVIVGDPSRGATVPAGDPLPGAPSR